MRKVFGDYMNRNFEKKCSDCKYYISEFECHNPVAKMDINKNTGEIIWTPCINMRHDNWACGNTAVLFEPKKLWWEFWKSELKNS
jgi:hypothetical protein